MLVFISLLLMALLVFYYMGMFLIYKRKNKQLQEITYLLQRKSDFHSQFLRENRFCKLN